MVSCDSSLRQALFLLTFITVVTVRTCVLCGNTPILFVIQDSILTVFAAFNDRFGLRQTDKLFLSSAAGY